jgi:hypothetical protein
LAENVACKDEVIIAYKIFVGKRERKIPFRKTAHREEDRTDLRELVWEGVEWINLV